MDHEYNRGVALGARDQARVSVFDSGFVLGDGVGEGLRVHDAGLPFLEAHLDRLYEGARAIDLDIRLTRAQLTQRIVDTLRATDGRSTGTTRLNNPAALRPTAPIGPSSPTFQRELSDRCRPFYERLAA